MNSSKIKGFTLIELLVVIAIIGLLSSVVLASLQGARLRAHDAERLSDMHQIYNALQLYYSTNGSYPLGVYDSRPICGGGTSSCGWDTTFSNFLRTSYPNGVPVDPTNNVGEGDMLRSQTPCGNCGMYYYSDNGTAGKGFILLARVAVNKNGNNSDTYSNYFQITQN